MYNYNTNNSTPTFMQVTILGITRPLAIMCGVYSSCAKQDCIPIKTPRKCQSILVYLPWKIFYSSTVVFYCSIYLPHPLFSHFTLNFSFPPYIKPTKMYPQKRLHIHIHRIPNAFSTYCFVPRSHFFISIHVF